MGFQVRMMILIGWLAFLFAWLMNILFYSVHPSFVDFSLKRCKEKCFIYVFGRKLFFYGTTKNPELELESLNKEENLQNNVVIEEERESLLGSFHENHLSSNSNLNSSFSTI